MITSLICDITFNVAHDSELNLLYHDKEQDAKLPIRRLPGR
jgi:hypothetical protein